MHYNGLITGLCFFFFTPVMAQDTTDYATTENQPSLQLLEFLADFGAIDNQTYELIEYHALQDSDKSDQEKSDEN